MLWRNLNMIVAVHSLPVGVTTAMSDPETAACSHYWVQGASHAAGRLNALDVSVYMLVLKGLPIRDHDKAIAVELSADELAEKLACPNLQD